MTTTEAPPILDWTVPRPGETDSDYYHRISARGYDTLVKPVLERARDGGNKLSEEKFVRLLGRGGRNYGPDTLALAYLYRLITDDIVTHTIGGIWSLAEFPQHCLMDSDWLCLFDVAGFTIDGNEADLPHEPIHLYRGAPHKYRKRWSWTTDRDKAQWFANRFSTPLEPAHVYEVDAPPESLLCIPGSEGRTDEHEVIVYTKGLQVTRSLTS